MRPAIKVGLSTASVYPLRTEAAFEYAAKLGYDGEHATKRSHHKDAADKKPE